MWLEGFLPAEQGTVVAAPLDRLADRLPAEPDAEPAQTIDARRADALVALCSQQVASDPDPVRAALSLHLDLAALRAGGSAELEGRGALHPALASMLCCDARLQAVLHDAEGHVVGIGQASRNCPEWLKRQLRRRDGEGCSFPGCHHKRFVDAHHIWPWEWGGPTDLDNLTWSASFITASSTSMAGGWRSASKPGSSTGSDPTTGATSPAGRGRSRPSSPRRKKLKRAA